MPKQAPGVRRYSDSSIEIEFRYKGVRCRERIKLEPTPANLKWAAGLKATVEHEIATKVFKYEKHFPESRLLKIFAQKPDTTVAAYVTDWLAKEKQNVKPSTWCGYDVIVRGHLIPAFGDILLADLTRKHIKDWIASQNISAKTLGNILSPLRIALDDAAESEIIETSPMAGWRLKRRRTTTAKGKARQVDPFSADEREAILDALKGQSRNFVQFAFWTGLRTSELCALDWTHIDWVRGVVFITHTLTNGMDDPEESTKTDAGRREVRLLAPALEALRDQKQYTYIKGVEIFQDHRGLRWDAWHIRNTMWLQALKKAGVRYRNPYQTRHTYASVMLMAGEHVMWVSKQLGHTDWAFTARTYSRWIPDDAPEAGKRAEATWKNREAK